MHAQLHPCTSVTKTLFFTLETHTPSSDPSMAMSTVLPSSHSAFPSILQTTARTRHLLSQWVAVCPAESTHGFVMQKAVQRVPSVQQQTAQTFLNETSQTQRQIPVKSIGRYKLFRCMPDCQEKFCKCSNEVWTAPRQGCQKLIPDDLQYRSSSSSVFSAKLLGFAVFLFRN